MEIIVPASLALIGLFTWSHKYLLNKIEELDRKIESSLTEEQIRSLLDDKLEALTVQVQDMKVEMREMDKKLDKLIVYALDKRKNVKYYND